MARFTQSGGLSRGAIDAVLTQAVLAQRDWARRGIAERAAFCTRFTQALLAHIDEIALELAWQMGRPIAQAPSEVKTCIERATFMIAAAEAGLAPLNPGPKDGFKRYVTRVPLGVVFVIAPWNYPLLTAVNSVVPAIMAGNTVVLKHAAQTQLVAERFQQAFDEAGLPGGSVSAFTDRGGDGGGSGAGYKDCACGIHRVGRRGPCGQPGGG